MHLKLIACSIFQRELCALLANTPHSVDVEFIEIAKHDLPNRLRELVQASIDKPGSRAYDAILLAYGICGNTATGLIARDVPLVIPRAHDCATILLGSRAAFLEHFGENPSHSFGCVGYFERGFPGYNANTGETGDRPITDPNYQKFVDDYGEENARYIWETLHPPVTDGRALFITTPPTRGHPAEAAYRAAVEREGLAYTELAGSMKMLDALLNGPWDAFDFLVVPPGQKINAMYDQVQVMTAAPLQKA